MAKHALQVGMCLPFKVACARDRILDILAGDRAPRLCQLFESGEVIFEKSVEI
jgi:hypothetical protein